MSPSYTGYEDLDTSLSRLYDLQTRYEKQGWDTRRLIGKQGQILRMAEDRKSINPNEVRRPK